MTWPSTRTRWISSIFPNAGAWRYRDYVIRALNHDRPFDRFIVEQIAGDLLPFEGDAQRAEQIVATQFLTQLPMNLVNQFKEQLRMDLVDGQKADRDRRTTSHQLVTERLETELEAAKSKRDG